MNKSQENHVISDRMSWFYWIAATSILNSIVNHFDGSRVFFLGSLISINLNDSFCLGAIRDFPVNAALIHFYGITLCLVVSAIFVVLGLMGSKLNQLAAIAGFGLYLLDISLIFLRFDWLVLLFHVWALYGIWSGLTEIIKANKQHSADQFVLE